MTDPHETQARVAVRAAMFNERGLFRDVGGTVAPRPDPVAAIETVRQGEIAAPPTGAVFPTVLDALAVPAVIDRTASATACDPISSADDTAMTVVVRDAGTYAAAGGVTGKFAAIAPAADPVFAIAPTEEKPAAATPSDRRATLRRLLASEGATARLAVSVDAVDQGLRVIADVDGLNQTERSRLRDRIAALLSRHGLAAHLVRLGGALPPQPEPH